VEVLEDIPRGDHIKITMGKSGLIYFTYEDVEAQALASIHDCLLVDLDAIEVPAAMSPHAI